MWINPFFCKPDPCVPLCWILWKTNPGSQIMEWVWSAMCSQPMTADWPAPPCAAPLDGLFRSGCARILEENCGVRWRSRPPAALLALIFSFSKARAARGPLLKGYIMSLFHSPCLSMLSFLFLPSLSTLALIPTEICLPIIFLFLLVHVRNNFVIVCLSWSIHCCLSGQFMFSSSSLITIPWMLLLFGLDQNKCFSGILLKI